MGRASHQPLSLLKGSQRAEPGTKAEKMLEGFTETHSQECSREGYAAWDTSEHR